MKKIYSLILFFAFTLLTFAQQKQPNISFETESYNFGKINETKGAVQYVFNFTNTGSEPLIIQNVQPSCGCTTPEWSREPVVPGGKGFIKATFNPAGRPGPFNKSINVTSNAIRNSVVLKISGEVIGKEPVADKYPFAVDNLRFSSTYISYGKISPNKPVTRNLEIMNTGKESVTISFPSVPPHIDVMVNPSTIKANQKAVIEFTYDAKKKNDWGFVTDAINYSLNNKKDAKYRLNLSAAIEDDYSDATPQQLADAPKLALEKNTINVGRIKAGENIQLSYKFKNMGKSNLVIRKINSSCGCTDVKARELIIKPGAAGEITGVFKSSGQKGAVNKTITLITNDPRNLNTVLWLKGTVE